MKHHFQKLFDARGSSKHFWVVKESWTHFLSARNQKRLRNTQLAIQSYFWTKVKGTFPKQCWTSSLLNPLETFLFQSLNGHWNEFLSDSEKQIRWCSHENANKSPTSASSTSISSTSISSTSTSSTSTSSTLISSTLISSTLISSTLISSTFISPTSDVSNLICQLFIKQFFVISILIHKISVNFCNVEFQITNLNLNDYQYIEF